MDEQGYNRAVLAMLASGLLILFAVWSLAHSIPDTPFFGLDRVGSSSYLDRIPAVDLKEIKLSHAKSVPRYDIGLFGNSRMVSISATHLGIKTERYFNFAIPGTSIRNSILMLERLIESGRLPRTVIIGLDNLYLEYFENPEAYLFPERISLVARDIKMILTRELPLYEGGKVLWRHLVKAWSTFETWLNFGAVSERISPFTSPPAPIYRVDGSRKQVIDTSSFPLNLALRQPSILIAVLRQDLVNLRAIEKANNIRVIVVETPLHPLSVVTGQRVERLRAFLHGECHALKLDCISISGTAIAPGAKGWPDATHAPAAAFGQAIAQILRATPHTK